MEFAIGKLTSVALDTGRGRLLPIGSRAHAPTATATSCRERGRSERARRARAGSAAQPLTACADRRPRRAAVEGPPRPHRDPPRPSRSLHLVSPTARPGRSKGPNATLDQPTIPDHPLPRPRVQGTPGGKGTGAGEGAPQTPRLPASPECQSFACSGPFKGEAGRRGAREQPREASAGQPAQTLRLGF
ncbi:hypothetical protein J1605_003882 [Eschrichtius robustus]|uniref:Uncharacterized protein n=1 Tax=Eschrichtius robustus TaxID=9764 RepID=A0AB34HLG5_ESCRO|nr:hypothetical protein J1605_003882 [Eschrichtius robustus]